MKIIHVMECFAGGTFDFLVNLTKNLPQYQHIIVHGKRENTPCDYRRYFSKKTVFITWKGVQREIRLLKDYQACKELFVILNQYVSGGSIIHLHGSKAGFIGRIVGRIIGVQKKIVYTAHGVSFLRKDTSWQIKWLYIILENLANFFGGRVIACSFSEGEIFKNYGIRNIEIIENGIAIPPKKRKVINNKIIIGTVGRITEAKNPKLFNEIAIRFLNNHKISFKWIGDGELRDDLRAKNLEITGWIGGAVFENNLNQIDIYLSTSLWEGMPLSVLQAMAMGKPVLLSNCVGNRDLVDGNGYLFENYIDALNKMQYLINDEELRIKLGEKSREILKNRFSLNDMLQKYNRIYRGLSI